MQRRDGSLTLFIQHEAPEGEKRANWMSMDVKKVENLAAMLPEE